MWDAHSVATFILLEGKVKMATYSMTFGYHRCKIFFFAFQTTAVIHTPPMYPYTQVQAYIFQGRDQYIFIHLFSYHCKIYVKNLTAVIGGVELPT